MEDMSVHGPSGHGDASEGQDYYTGPVGKSNWGDRVEHDRHGMMSQEHRDQLDSITTKLGFDPEQVRADAEQFGADGKNAQQTPEVYENGNYLLQQAAMSWGAVADPNKSFDENNANFAEVIKAASAAAAGEGDPGAAKELLSEFGSPAAQNLSQDEVNELFAFEPHQNGIHSWGGAGSNPDSNAWTFIHAGALNYREPEGEVASHGFSNDQHQGYQGPDGRGAHAEESAQAGFDAFNLSQMW
jgi:hypothetical protein